VRRESPQLWPWGIAAGLAICSLAAIARSTLSGELVVSDKPTTFETYVWWGFGVGMALAGVSYVIALRCSGAALDRGHLAVAFGIHLCAAAATPLTSNDVFLNLAHGRLVRLGLNPYQHAMAELPRGDPFARVDWPGPRNPYGPLVLPVSVWAAGWGSVAGGVVAFKLAMLAASLGALFLAYCFCRGLPMQEGPPTFALLAFNPLFAWELSGQAHNDALMALPAVGFIWAAAVQRRILAALLLGLCVAVKFAMAPTLVLYLLALARRGKRETLLAALGAFGLLAAAWAPWWEGAGTLQGAWTVVKSNPARIQNSFASIVRLLGNLAGELETALRAWTLGTTLVMLGAALIFALRSTNVPRAMEGSLRFTALGLAFGLPYVQPWYATWLLPLTLAPAAREQRLGVALYTTLVPALYFTRAAGAFAIVIVQGVGLALVLAPAKFSPIFDWLARREEGDRSA